jgi:hypothetical protein
MYGEAIMSDKKLLIKRAHKLLDRAEYLLDRAYADHSAKVGKKAA